MVCIFYVNVYMVCMCTRGQKNRARRAPSTDVEYMVSLVLRNLWVLSRSDSRGGLKVECFQLSLHSDFATIWVPWIEIVYSRLTLWEVMIKNYLEINALLCQYEFETPCSNLTSSHV
jgi:hypothetical protein